jgi:hypothetical protein
MPMSTLGQPAICYTATMVSRSRRIVGIVALYVVMIAFVIYMTVEARSAAMAGAEARAQEEWTKWREDVRSGKVPDDGTVSRRTPGSTEPPWLVLMRDHFAVCLTAAVTFSSLLFFVTTYFLAAVRK